MLPGWEACYGKAMPGGWSGPVGYRQRAAAYGKGVGPALEIFCLGGILGRVVASVRTLSGPDRRHRDHRLTWPPVGFETTIEVHHRSVARLPSVLSPVKEYGSGGPGNLEVSQVCGLSAVKQGKADDVSHEKG
jgi:hypothetical protein